MNEFQYLEETIKLLGLSHKEVMDYLAKKDVGVSAKIRRNNAIVPAKTIDILQVKSGMFWYEDNTFSYERLTSKKIKAVVELVENGVIYGDLTASELLDIKEQKLPWNDAKRFIEEFSYPCQENEKIVLYDIGQLKKVYGIYEVVKQVFYRVGKPFRNDYYWSSTERYSTDAWTLIFSSGNRYTSNKYYSRYVRPVLALKIF